MKKIGTPKRRQRHFQKRLRKRLRQGGRGKDGERKRESSVSDKKVKNSTQNNTMYVAVIHELLCGIRWLCVCVCVCVFLIFVETSNVFVTSQLD